MTDRKRYSVVEVDGFSDGVRVFRVDWNGGGFGRYCNVWFSQVDDRTNCTMCSGLVSAMLTGCAHCQAVRRHLARLP